MQPLQSFTVQDSREKKTTWCVSPVLRTCFVGILGHPGDGDPSDLRVAEAQQESAVGFGHEHVLSLLLVHKAQYGPEEEKTQRKEERLKKNKSFVFEVRAGWNGNNRITEEISIGDQFQTFSPAVRSVTGAETPSVFLTRRSSAV